MADEFPKKVIVDGAEDKRQPEESRPLVQAPAGANIVIDGERIECDITRLELFQAVDDHHLLQVRLREVGKVSADEDFGDPKKYTSFLGKSLSLTIKISEIGIDEELGFIGIVTRVNLENSIDGLNVYTIVAHSPTIVMDGARHNAFYFEQSAGDIIGSILKKHPITLGRTDATRGQLRFSVQYRETDYAYVMRLAGGSGLFAFYDGREFRAVKASSADVVDLIWRETLGVFDVGLGTAPSEYSGVAYNYEQKKTYAKDTKSLPSQTALSEISRTAPEASKEIYGDSGFSGAPRVVADTQSLDEILQRERSRAVDRMITCSGQSLVPSVAPGHCVRVKGMNKLDGVYWINSVRHVVDESGKYSNSFKGTPLDTAFPQYKSRRATVTNLQTAVVVDNNDPEKLGRVKVKFPWNDADESPWVRMVTSHAGSERGIVFIPEVGDEVLVGYEFGSPDYPIILGALYNKEESPPGDTGGENNDIKLIITRGGNKIYLSDKDGDEEIQVAMKDNQNTIVMKASGPSLSIESQGDISIKGKNITIESQQEFKIKGGTNLNVESGANYKAKGGAMVEIEGAMVTVKGNPIQLN